MKFYCLINPFSGGKRGQALIKKLEAALVAGTFEGKVVESSLENFAQQVRAAKGYDCLVLGGGDGTVSNALQYVDDMEIPIAILPLGTANDLARELGATQHFSAQFPLSIIEAYKAAKKKPLALWKVFYGAKLERSLFFCNYISFGFDGLVMDSVARVRRSYPEFFKVTGVLGTRILYVLTALRHLCSPRFKIGKLIPLDNSTKAPPFISSRPMRTLFIANIQAALGLGKSNLTGCAGDKKLEVLPIYSVLAYAAFIFPFLRKVLLPQIFSLENGLEINGLDKTVRFQVDGEEKPEMTGSNIRIEFVRWLELLTP